MTTNVPGNIRPELAALNSAKAWNQVVDVLRVAGEQAIRDGFNGALDERDAIERFMGLVAILSCTTRMALLDEPEAPMVMTFDLVPGLTKIGGNSPDADYFNFNVNSYFQYRLRGQRGLAPFFSIQSQAMRVDPETQKPGMYLSGLITDDQLQVDSDGNFEVLVSTEKPADYTGNWLALDNNSFCAVVRQYHHDREKEPELKFTVEVLNPLPEVPVLNDFVVTKRLALLANFSKFWFDARKWYEESLDDSTLNRFLIAEKGDESRSQDLALAADVQYEVGRWQLAEDEALVVEGTPPDSVYWIFQLCDRWMETADFRRRRVFRNNSQITLNADGTYRIVVAAKDPGVPNWVDNGGRAEGYMSFRWSPTKNKFKAPSAKVVKVDSLRA